MNSTNNTGNNNFVEHNFKQAYSALNNNDLAKAKEMANTIQNTFPDRPQTLHLLAMIANQEHGRAACITWLIAACRLNADANIWYDLGLMLANNKQLGPALDAYSRASALAPNNINSILNMAALLRQSGNHMNAIGHYRLAIKRQPNDYRAHLGLASTLHFLRHLEDAEPHYQNALKLSNSSSDVCWEYAMQSLLNGDFKQGWKFYDARLDKPSTQTSIYPFEHPLWQGEPLKNKTVLIHGEQGFGDEIMFASIIPEIIEQAKQVILVTAPALSELFKHSFPNATVYSLDRQKEVIRNASIDWLKKHKKIHFQCPIGSLPRWTRNSIEDFKATTYIKATEKRLDYFKDKLTEKWGTTNELNTLKVGLVWQGNLQTGLMGQRKSLSIERLTPLATVANVSFISLQMLDPPQSINSESPLQLTSLSNEISDFNDTAALISQLDLVITVDTAVAHLAAAMGKETWVMLWYSADWRYLVDADHSHWYPNMRLFRQTEAGKWSNVVNQVTSELKRKAVHK